MKEDDSNSEITSLSEETKADYMDAFNMFDTNHDGTINSQKIGELMRKLGKNPTESQLNQIIGNIAKNGSKQIGFDDFVELMEQKNKENNGLISNEELFHIIRTFGETLTDEEIREIITEADVDGDGYINYEEFVRMMTTK